MVGATAMQIGPESEGGVRIDFISPARLDGAVVRCFGGGEASVAITATGIVSSAGERVDVPCDEEPHDVAVAVTEAASVVVTASSDAPTYLHALLRGTPPPKVDEWIGRFDARAAEVGGSGSVVWGDFGLPGATAAHTSTDATLAAGPHRVLIECDGPTSVTATIADGSAAALVSKEVGCPGSIALDVTSEAQGLAVTVDSDGEPGAFLIAIDGTF